MSKVKTKRKKTKELIVENAWLMSLKPRPRVIMGVLHYRFKEILIILIIIILGVWLVTAKFKCNKNSIDIESGINIDYKTGVNTKQELPNAKH